MPWYQRRFNPNISLSPVGTSEVLTGPGWREGRDNPAAQQ